MGDEQPGSTSGAVAAGRRVRPRPLSRAAATWRVFELAFGQMLWARRSVFLALLVAGPVVLTGLLRVVRALTTSSFAVNGADVSGPELFGLMIWLIYVRFVVPVLGVFYGTSLLADEVEDKTLTYLFSRPIPRGAVILGKYLAYLACTSLLILPSVTLVYFGIVTLGGGHVGREFPALVADLAMIGAGLAAYGAVFGFIGARLGRPLVAGLVFVIGWEPGVLLFPGYLKQFTVAYYLQALVPHAMPEDGALVALLSAFRELPGIAYSVAALLVITLGGLALAVRAVETREYVLEQ